MHPRNPYASAPPDFASLARVDAHFARYVRLNADGTVGNVDFKDGDAVRALTETLLKHDFGITAKLRDDRLCPAVPNRINYLLWIHDILDASIPLMDFLGWKADEAERENVAESSTMATRRIRGLDIGTGASAIYPVLGCALNEQWKFVATDIDPVSLSHAQTIVDEPSNNRPSTRGKNLRLADRIRLIQVSAEDTFFDIPADTAPTIEKGKELGPDDSLPFRFHFSMCNPPFYESNEEMEESAERKTSGPNAVCSGAPGEMITSGGEVAFVRRMMDESAQKGVRERILWYTTLVGKLSSIASLVKHLHALQITNYAITEFVQGQTRRWGIAWSFWPCRFPDHLARPRSAALSHLSPPSNIRTREFHSRFPDLAEASTALRTVLDAIDGARVTEKETQTQTKRNTEARTNTSKRKLEEREDEHASGPSSKIRAQEGASRSAAQKSRDTLTNNDGHDGSSAHDKLEGSADLCEDEDEDVDVDEKESIELLVRLTADTWSRAARRAKARAERSPVSTATSTSATPSFSTPPSTATFPLCCRLLLRTIKPRPTLAVVSARLAAASDSPPFESFEVEIQWTWGQEGTRETEGKAGGGEGSGPRALFESFANHVLRKLGG